MQFIHKDLPEKDEVLVILYSYLLYYCYFPKYLVYFIYIAIIWNAK
ncbi:hypothetical protein ASZ90_018899 [hydrocarbon metagenome]|uniref:Uncharacterized protein n=1 Tax=hydrocarbon metagenome TaxID=938273 RepID=A0A0W8E5K5_9ZZZZ